MSSTPAKQSKDSSLRDSDMIVIFICLLGTALSLFMFHRDLFMSLRSSSQLAGTVTLKHNIVQRRLRERVIWDRLAEESPVYDGDYIRVANLSGATLNVDENSVELDENTLIRIQITNGVTTIDTFTGRMNVSSGEDSGIILLHLGDKIVETSPGTAFSASSGENGIELHITEGTATVTQDGLAVELTAGDVIVNDAQGNEVLKPMAVVMQPKSNAAFLKTEARLLNVDFIWKKINMPPVSPVRLEIAQDRGFNNITRVLENLDTSAVCALDTGLWQWRLSFENTVLASGRVTVTEASPPLLLSPAQGVLISYRRVLPEVQFRWSEVSQAVNYILRVSSSPDLSNPQIEMAVQGTTFITPNLGSGTWYWRVQPVFSNAYEGDTLASQTSFFKIEQGGEPSAVTLILPASNSTVFTGENRDDIYFSWANVREAVSYTINIFASGGSSSPLISKTVGDNFFLYKKDENNLIPGQYFWGVSYTDAEGYSSPLSQTRIFIAAEKGFVQKLIYPPDNFIIETRQLPDLTFTWETSLPYDRRFQVSAQQDFSKLEIDESVREYYYRDISISVGTWYWRIVSKQDSLSAAVPTAARRFTVTLPPVVETVAPVKEVRAEPPASVSTPPASTPTPTKQQTSLFPAPGNRLPSSGYRIDAEQLRQKREINFSWSAVQGANSYILTIYRQSSPRRVQVFQADRINSVNYTFDKFELLDSGTFIWQVEAVYYNRNGKIERRGRPGENTFVLNVPRPGRVQTRETGILYGIE